MSERTPAALFALVVIAHVVALLWLQQGLLHMEVLPEPDPIFTRLVAPPEPPPLRDALPEPESAPILKPVPVRTLPVPVVQRPVPPVPVREPEPQPPPREEPPPAPRPPQPPSVAVAPQPVPTPPAVVPAPAALSPQVAPPVAMRSEPTAVSPASGSAPPAHTRPEPTPPRFDVAYLDNPKPLYPVMAQRMGLQGRVLLRVLVSAQGRAEQVELKESSGASVLDRAATESVRQWRFVPARIGDNPVSMWVVVPIKFTLKDR